MALGGGVKGGDDTSVAVDLDMWTLLLLLVGVLPIALLLHPYLVVVLVVNSVASIFSVTFGVAIMNQCIIQVMSWAFVSKF